MQTISFYPVSVESATIDVEYVGDVSIKGFDEVGKQFYISIITSNGMSYITKVYPVVAEALVLPKKCAIEFEAVEYKEGKLYNTIKNFLLSCKVCEAEVIPHEEFVMVIDAVSGLLGGMYEGTN